MSWKNEIREQKYYRGFVSVVSIAMADMKIKLGF